MNLKTGIFAFVGYTAFMFFAAKYFIIPEKPVKDCLFFAIVSGVLSSLFYWLFYKLLKQFANKKKVD